MNKLSFSGHGSFTCKQFWLKKVFDFSESKGSFSDETVVVDLGVGKNMVGSLRFWGKAFGILDEKDAPTDMATYLFGCKGKDIYLENYGTIWLLHYLLVKTGRASIYDLVFNEFRKERVDFTKEQLQAFLNRKCQEASPNTYNDSTVKTDINVFLRNYIKPEKDEKFEIEDDFSGLLIDLDLVKLFKQRIDGAIIHWHRIEGQDRIDLPYQIVLYAILDNYHNQSSITFRELQVGQNSPGMVFALNAEGLYNKLQQIARHYKQITYTETAGNQLLQFRASLKPVQILNEYYAS
jgi:hypothetical protein